VEGAVHLLPHKCEAQTRADCEQEAHKHNFLTIRFDRLFRNCRGIDDAKLLTLLPPLEVLRLAASWLFSEGSRKPPSCLILARQGGNILLALGCPFDPRPVLVNLPLDPCLLVLQAFDLQIHGLGLAVQFPVTGLFLGSKSLFDSISLIFFLILTMSGCLSVYFVLRSAS